MKMDQFIIKRSVCSLVLVLLKWVTSLPCNTGPSDTCEGYMERTPGQYTIHKSHCERGIISPDWPPPPSSLDVNITIDANGFPTYIITLKPPTSSMSLVEGFEIEVLMGDGSIYCFTMNFTQCIIEMDQEITLCFSNVSGDVFYYARSLPPPPAEYSMMNTIEAQTYLADQMTQTRFKDSLKFTKMRASAINGTETKPGGSITVTFLPFDWSVFRITLIDRQHPEPPVRTPTRVFLGDISKEYTEFVYDLCTGVYDITVQAVASGTGHPCMDWGDPVHCPVGKATLKVIAYVSETKVGSCVNNTYIVVPEEVSQSSSPNLERYSTTEADSDISDELLITIIIGISITFLFSAIVLFALCHSAHKQKIIENTSNHGAADDGTSQITILNLDRQKENGKLQQNGHLPIQQNQDFQGTSTALSAEEVATAEDASRVLAAQSHHITVEVHNNGTTPRPKAVSVFSVSDAISGNESYNGYVTGLNHRPTSYVGKNVDAQMLPNFVDSASGETRENNVSGTSATYMAPNGSIFPLKSHVQPSLSTMEHSGCTVISKNLEIHEKEKEDQPINNEQLLSLESSSSGSFIPDNFEQNIPTGKTDTPHRRHNSLE